MSNHQPAKILCNTTASVFLMTEDGIQTHRRLEGFMETIQIQIQ